MHVFQHVFMVHLYTLSIFSPYLMQEPEQRAKALHLSHLLRARPVAVRCISTPSECSPEARNATGEQPRVNLKRQTRKMTAREINHESIFVRWSSPMVEMSAASLNQVSQSTALLYDFSIILHRQLADKRALMEVGRERKRQNGAAFVLVGQRRPLRRVYNQK